MKVAKYIFALWVGVLIYASLTIFLGARGLSAQYQLDRELKRQEENIGTLELIRNQLEDVKGSLMYDEDTLIVHIREQGYASPREQFARIVGLGTNQNNLTNQGSVIIAAEPQYFRNQIIKIISLSVGIAVLVCAATFDFLKRLREK